MTIAPDSAWLGLRRFSPVLLALAMVFASHEGAFADSLEIVGQGSVQYDSRQPKPEDRAKAFEAAKISILEDYASGMSTSERRNFDAISSTLKANIDNYVKQPSKLDEETDKDSKTYTVYVRANVDVTAVDEAIQKTAGGGDFAEREYILFTFAARRQSEIKSFDAKRTTRADTDSTTGAEEAPAGNAQNAVSSTSKRTSEIKVSGGSTVQKSDEIQYAVFSSESVNTAVSQVFTEANFEVVPIFEVDGTIGDLFKGDFSHGEDVSNENRKYATDVTRDADIPFFAYGLLDVGQAEVDPATGQDVVVVSVNAQIYDLTKRFARKVASVGTQYRGFGSTVTSAQENALRLAAEKTASDLTQQLMSKGIR